MNLSKNLKLEQNFRFTCGCTKTLYATCCLKCNLFEPAMRFQFAKSMIGKRVCISWNSFFGANISPSKLQIPFQEVLPRTQNHICHTWSTFSGSISPWKREHIMKNVKTSINAVHEESNHFWRCLHSNFHAKQFCCIFLRLLSTFYCTLTKFTLTIELKSREKI